MHNTTDDVLLNKKDQFINSIKSLEKDFDRFINEREPDNANKLMECQSEFWNEHVTRVINQDESEPTMNNLFWNLCFLTHFYNSKIFDDWQTMDLDNRKLTILLGIYNLEKNLNDQSNEEGPKTSDGK